MSVRAASCAVIAVAGLVTAIVVPGVADADARPLIIFAAAVVAAVATGAAVELRVPGLVGGGRRHASNAGFAWVVVVYGLVVGAFWWILLDSDDEHALFEMSGLAEDYLVAAAAVVTVAAGFALGRWRAVPVLTALAFVVGMALTANDGPCGGFMCIPDGAIVGLVTVVAAPALVFLGVGARQFADDGLMPPSGRLVSGAVALLVVLAVACVVR